MTTPRALLIAAYDSQLKWCSSLRTELAERGFTCEAVAPSDLKSALSPTQIADAGFDHVDLRPWDEIVRDAAGCDVVVVALAGPLVQRLCHDLAEQLESSREVGPVLVSGWVGIIIEKITAGYLDRACTDVVAVNSGADLRHFAEVGAALGIGSENLVLTGLPFLSSRPAAPRAQRPPRTVLWADQPTVPAAPRERRHVYDRLIAYAEQHPDRTVMLKPRHRPGEDTFHRMKHHPEDVLEGVPTPENFAIVYDPITQLLDDTDLLLTVSSTACLEALDRGLDVALVADLGIHERYGNQVFLDSGLLRTFEQVAADEIGSMSDSFRDSYFGGRDLPPAQVLADRVEKLLATAERPSRDVWASTYVRGVWAARDAVGASAPSRRAPLWRRVPSAGRRKVVQATGDVRRLVRRAL
ncbi:DUF6716 putative glycosyltransferase [Aeromicrobium sp. Leaf350]|uniref:DUF6716 putative glycosyltransferase n=1 Tax=Aeromicrobium sp. Leaf350 TaxID=2876565 RepID=UPI001E560ACA|nr:DUF6716 putative glycosyltransferase [Aeromicrobium sp. Leaf350]